MAMANNYEFDWCIFDNFMACTNGGGDDGDGGDGGDTTKIIIPPKLYNFGNMIMSNIVLRCCTDDMSIC